jgi:hypothetical protein
LEKEYLERRSEMKLVDISAVRGNHVKITLSDELYNMVLDGIYLGGFMGYIQMDVGPEHIDLLEDDIKSVEVLDLPEPEDLTTPPPVILPDGSIDTGGVKL